MPATPAWPPKSLPRLFVGTPLSEGVRVELDAGQANYLGNVMRLGEGAKLLAFDGGSRGEANYFVNVMRLGEGAKLLTFDGESGEWLARIAEAGKKRMTLVVDR